MNRQLSAYLDLMRVVCATLVVLSHLGHGHLVGGYLWPFTAVGNEAVMAFFVLSGFVIAFVTDQREHNASTYAAARLARLYSVILPAMLLTLGLDAIGQAINAQSYTNSHAAASDSPLTGYVLSALMLNQSWALNQHFGSNGAYWSIPFEFWYYFMFGAFMLLKGWARWLFTLLGATLAGPKILALLPVWLMGVTVYHLLQRHKPSHLALVAALGSLALLAGMLWTDVTSFGQSTFWGMAPDSRPWQYVVGLCFAVHIYGATGFAQWLAKPFMWFARPLALLSGSTLALYLFHLPIIGVVNAVAAAQGRSVYTTTAMIVLPFAVALTLGYWCELQKKPLRALLLKLWRVNQCPPSR
ncbi:acyltransferase [Rhodoferax sp. BLA1]|uniref:acyltransferase family protein n=1 Tax=Rhodoferax sp. BLA1 TaxID=2576062 RepID=UPI0015D17A78|nr:acyltransferase [Rhodoferax sp. BLA1]